MSSFFTLLEIKAFYLDFYLPASAEASPVWAGMNAKKVIQTREQPLLFDLEGDLALHGKTKRVIVKISTYQFNDRLITEGSTVLFLKDFAIRNPSLLFLRVSNEVKINFHIESTHKISL